MKKNTGKAPAEQFYYKDFLADMAEHDPDIIGAWMLVLIKIWHLNNSGSVTKTLSQFAKIMHTDQIGAKRIIDYFRAEKIADVTEDNGRITIVNRRAKRDSKLREDNRLRQEAFRRNTKSNATVTPEKPNPSSSTSSSSSTSVIKTYSEDSDEYRLAKLLLKIILTRKPNLKKPNLQKWAKEIGLMFSRDSRTKDQIEKVIRWSQDDEFWQNNILSTNKLRKHFDLLELKADGSNRKTTRTGRQESQSTATGTTDSDSIDGNGAPFR